MGVGGQRHAPVALLPGKRPDAHLIGSWADPGPVWTGVGYLSFTGIRSEDRPARSDSLYRLRSPGPHNRSVRLFNNIVMNCWVLK